MCHFIIIFFKSHSVVSNSLRPPVWTSCMHVWTPCMNPIQSMEFSRPEYWSGYPFSSPGDLPNPGIERRSPLFQADSLPAESQGKPKSTIVGSLSLLQTPQSLLHCRRILYQLTYQVSPMCYF